MGAIAVDADKCTGCGACVAECPVVVLQMEADLVAVTAEGRCIGCGHCVAVCPTAAVAHSGLPGPCDAVNPALAVEPQALLQLVRTRRSVRAYTEEPVSDEDLQAIIQAAVYAPTAHNAQAWQFTVIRGRDQLAPLADAVADYMQSILHTLADRSRREALAAATSPQVVENLRSWTPTFRAVVQAHRAGRDMIFRGAPALMVIHAPRQGLIGTGDCVYASANAGLMAHGLGLGSCLVGFLVAAANNSPEVAAKVGLPPENAVGAALVVGHPQYRYDRIVPRRPVAVEWR